jgi:hypothetical protein
MEKAQAAGRNDGRLKENIERVELAIKEHRAFTDEEIRKAEQEQERERERYAKFEGANANIRSKNAGNRIRGCHDLAALAGAEAVPAVVYVMQTDTDYTVREACTVALGSLGPAAKSALPNLKAMLNHNCGDDQINLTKEQMDASMKCADFKRAVRDALQKVQR